MVCPRFKLMNKVFAEFIGTFALVFAGCGAVMVTERFPGALNPNMISVVFGLVVAAMIYSVGHISGAHFNPAVTLAFAIGRHFPGRQVAPYWAAQFSGGMVAIALLTLLLPKGTTFGATIPNIPIFQALGWETVLSFILMIVIVSVATDSRAVGKMAGAAIGSTVTVVAIVGGPVTGASMNPARSLAPALFQTNLSELWIYIVGPMIGAALATLSYNFIRCDDQLPGVETVSSTKSAKGCC